MTLLESKMSFRFGIDEMTEIPRKLRSDAYFTVLDMAQDAKTIMIEFAPIKTGELRTSIQVIQTPEGIIVRPTKACAVSAELRHEYVRRTFEQAQQKLPSYIAQIKIG